MDDAQASDDAVDDGSIGRCFSMNGTFARRGGAVANENSATLIILLLGCSSNEPIWKSQQNCIVEGPLWMRRCGGGCAMCDWDAA